MINLYKLTDSKSQTRNGMHWPIGATNIATGEGNKLCSPGVLHGYSHPLLAVLLAPIHVNYDTLRLMEVITNEVVAHDGTKVGAKQMTVIRELELPTITTEQRVTFTIYCSLSVCQNNAFVKWADACLSSEYKSQLASESDAMAAAAIAAADAAADDAAWVAVVNSWNAVLALRDDKDAAHAVDMFSANAAEMAAAAMNAAGYSEDEIAEQLISFAECACS